MQDTTISEKLIFAELAQVQHSIMNLKNRLSVLLRNEIQSLYLPHACTNSLPIHEFSLVNESIKRYSPKIMATDQSEAVSQEFNAIFLNYKSYCQHGRHEEKPWDIVEALDKFSSNLFSVTDESLKKKRKGTQEKSASIEAELRNLKIEIQELKDVIKVHLKMPTPEKTVEPPTPKGPGFSFSN